MSSRSQQQQQAGGLVHCPACGRPTPGPRFCDNCGASLPGTVPVASQVHRSGAGLWLGVWILVLLVAGAGGLAFGFFTGPGGGPSVPTAEQQAVVDAHGVPAAFILADGPTGPGEGSVRLEQWLYPDTGAVVYFLDGRRVNEDTLTFTSEFAAASSTPWAFGRAMRATDVEDLLGERGIPLPEVASAFDGYEAYAYEGNRLLVGYLDGWVYTVQTY